MPESRSGEILTDAAAFAAQLERGKRLLGLDLGTKTIGVALSDVTRMIASGYETIIRTKFTADATRLVVGGPQVLWLVLFAGVCTAMQVFLQYTQYVAVLKWLALVLLAYVATLFMVHVPWGEALTGLVVPTIRWEKDYLTTFVAVLGTTISP